MKIKVNEAEGAVLDWLVAKCEGKELYFFADDPFKKDPWLVVNNTTDQPLHSFNPSTDWSFGGPIIEGKEIQLATERGGEWVASIPRAVEIGDYRKYSFKTGPTPLIAAMRCYVVSKLGEEVEIPEELE